MIPWVVAITGATGVVYARQLLMALGVAGERVCLTISGPGMRVVHDELGWELTGDRPAIQRQLREYLGYPPDDATLSYYDWQDIGCCLASGSFPTRGMLVIPCSMATVAGIAHGLSRNLIERAADVTLKEGRPLLLVPRETPLNAIHLKNLLSLAKLGVRIVPPMPSFYFRPQKIEDLVDSFVERLLVLAGVHTTVSHQWGVFDNEG